MQRHSLLGVAEKSVPMECARRSVASSKRANLKKLIIRGF